MMGLNIEQAPVRIQGDHDDAEYLERYVYKIATAVGVDVIGILQALHQP